MMTCPMCRAETPKWENADKYRIKQEGMALCTECGFVSYPERYKTKAEIIKYYEKDYRSAPQVGNVYTGQRKLHYHSQFLQPVFKKWIEGGNKAPVVSDIGAAFGMFLGWVKDHFPDADINGVELTKSFVRNAWHEYGVKLDSDFDDTKKYDLISSYKSLEHILDPDIELSRYIDSLKDDGVLYLSVPIWFKAMVNFGSNKWDIEYYYHPNHINTWTQDQFEALIEVCGGEIVQRDYHIYESTYLIKRNESLKTKDRSSLKQDPNRIKEYMARVYAANEAFQMGKLDDAVKIWPNFPMAHIARYEHNRKIFHELGFDKIYNEPVAQALESCPDEASIEYLAADVCMRYNKYELALQHLDRCLQLRPHMPNVYSSISNCFRVLAERSVVEKEKIEFFKKSREAATHLKNTNLQYFAEATNWIMFDNSNIPTPFEG